MPKTNADRIREMSIDEMAKIINCPHMDGSGECIRNCTKCRKEWLESEVEE